MKKLIIFPIIAVLITGAVFAQPIREQRNSVSNENSEQSTDNTQSRSGRARAGKLVSVEGVLKLEKGFVAVESADTVYYVPMLNRYIGFITGLREGARVSIEGYEFRKMIRPTNVTIDGKSYDFIAWNRGQRFGKQDFRPDNNRSAPPPRWNNQGGGRHGCR